jgi:hypothetical protein
LYEATIRLDVRPVGDVEVAGVEVEADVVDGAVRIGRAQKVSRM